MIKAETKIRRTSRRTSSELPSISASMDAHRADYDMSRENRFIRRRTGLAPQGGAADYHYRTESLYYRDIEKARDMDRNDSIIGQTIDRAVSNIVQDGFSLDPQTGDKSLNDELWNRWQEWATDADLCDVAGDYTFHDFESQAMRSCLLDGDAFVLAIEDGSLQFAEAHVVQTPNIIPDTVLGVTRNTYGGHVQYWLQEDPLDPLKQKGESVPIDVYDADGLRQAFQIYNPKRKSQTRGVTALAPIFSLAGMFEDIQFAKLVQQQVVSCFAIFRQKAATGGVGLPNRNAGYGLPETEPTETGTRYIENIAPGMEIIGEPGETLQGFSPNVPNSEYFNHVKLMLQMIGVNLGLPLCLVLMDGSETNFSGWRGAVDEARKGFKSNQRNLVNRFHKLVYQFKVTQWMESDAAIRRAAAKSDVSIFKHKWNAPRWSYIDPVGDATGDQLRLQNGLTSPRRLHGERGQEWEEVAEEIVEDNYFAIVKAKQSAKRINDAFQDGQPVHWRELINMPMPQGLQMTMQDPQVVEAQKQQAQVAATSGTGEMANASRRQFTNNQKAIGDLLSALINDSMSEARVRVGLSTLGLSKENVDALILDAKDGTVDTDLTGGSTDGE